MNLPMRLVSISEEGLSGVGDSDGLSMIGAV